jgi:3-deoxy-manno-octulosonate cytidylyltransferase (CMP-KDO synthetase)
MSATRLPNKPMLKIAGIPMIEHVYYRTKLSKRVDITCVATCDKVIFDHIESIGGMAIMTSRKHQRATDRTAEAIKKLSMKIKNIHYVAMIQGDEPLVSPKQIDYALKVIQSNRKINIVNLMGKLKNHSEFNDHNEVKVVTDLYNNALYFSREPIPSAWKKNKNIRMMKQTGLIFFKKDYLLYFDKLKETPLEKIESVDMMRVLENGDKIKMVETSGELLGIDSMKDLKTVRIKMKKDLLIKHYLNK